MRMVWSGAPADEFLPARDRLVRWFDEWAHLRGQRVLSPVVEAIIDDRWALGDGLLGRWQPEDFAEELLVRFPRHVTVAPEDLGVVVTTVQAFVDFLDDRGLTDARCAGRDELTAALAGMADTFVKAMGDESMFGLTKFWDARLTAAGLDAGGAEAAERFLADVQAERIPIDPELLDQVVANHLDDDIELPPRMPLVILPDAAELHSYADLSLVVHRIRAVVAWASTGRLLTRDGSLAPVDAGDLAALVGDDHELMLMWAREARVVRTVRDRLVPVRAAAPIVADPVALAQGAFEAFFELAADVCAAGPDRSLLRRAFEDATLALVMALYARQGPMTREDLEDLLYEVADMTVDPDVDERSREAVDADTERVLAALEVLGAVDLDGPDVLLTPLGRTLVARHLREHGVSVPTIETLVDETAEVVIATAVGAGPAEREVLMDAWTAKNEHARHELLTLIERTDDPAHRALATVYADELGARVCADRTSAGGGGTHKRR